MQRKKLLFVAIIFFYFISTCYPFSEKYNCSFVTMIQFMQLHNDLKLLDILIITNNLTENTLNDFCDMFPNDLALKSDPSFTTRMISRNALSTHFTRLNIRQESSSIVIIPFDYAYDNQKDIIQKIQSSMSLSIACWLFVYPIEFLKSYSKNDIQVFFDDSPFKYIEHLKFDSQIYIAFENSSDTTQLFEVYRICENSLPIIRHVPILMDNVNSITFNHDFFIWERRKNLQGCRLPATFIPTSSAFHEIRNDSESSKKSNYRSDSLMYSSSVEIDGMSYFGTSADVFNILMTELNFTLKAVIPEKRSYGIYDPTTQRWNGIIGVLAENRAEFSLNDLTVTSSRSEVADFVAPIYFQCKYQCTHIKISFKVLLWFFITNINDFFPFQIICCL